MKFSLSHKEARAMRDPIKERDLRREICKEIHDMNEKELQATLRNIQRKKGKG